MKSRYKRSNGEYTMGDCSKFNIHAMNEVFFYGDDELVDAYPSEVEVFLEAKQTWMNLSEAFKTGDVIVNEWNSEFREPNTFQERKQGYYY